VFFSADPCLQDEIKDSCKEKNIKNAFQNYSKEAHVCNFIENLDKLEKYNCLIMLKKVKMTTSEKITPYKT